MKRIDSWIIPVILMLCAGQPLWAVDYPAKAKFFEGSICFAVSEAYKIDLGDKPAARLDVDHIDRFLNDIGAYKVERAFPHCQPPLPGGTDLTNIYYLYFSETLSYADVCQDMVKLDGIEFAEPRPIHELYLDHNDTHRDLQYGLDLCQANDAHDVSTGDPATVVGIIDTGVDNNHPDLMSNFWINPGEDLNGNRRVDNDERNNRDDDGNGYVDDFYGWDYVGDDNDPNDEYGHGTHCAGIASAVTNNNRGVASVGYSCSIMMVRVGNGDIPYGYEGIEYAADNGADVISCSWGGYYGGAAGRRVIDYATEHGSLVLVAAGNDNVENRLYPAAYENAVAVAATDENDRRAGFSNYGDWIDISAPGLQIVSTVPGGDYAYMSGTSMACPFAASVAVLIRATYPDLTVEEARQVLFDGADDIAGVNDERYEGKLGAGRINAYESLMLGERPILSIEALEFAGDDNDNGRIEPGETADIYVSLSNSENGVETETVNISIFSSDTTLIFWVNEIDFPNISPGEQITSEIAFELEVAEDVIPHTSWITINVAAEPGHVRLSKTYEVIIGFPRILLIDDDEGQDIDEYYSAIVDQMGQGWVKWDAVLNDTPLAYVLLDYDMVIWITGRAEEPLNELDRIQLELAIEDGANVLLVGKNIGDFDENRVFLREYFGAEHGQDSILVNWVRGLPGGRPVLEENIMFFADNLGSGDGRSSPSTMTPVNGADSLMVYLSGRDQHVSGCAGVYRHHRNWDSRVIYLGYSFEGGSGYHGHTEPYIVLQHMFNWLTGDDHAAPFDDLVNPSRFSLEPAYPNPFNGIVSIAFSLPMVTGHNLAIYDVRGGQVDILGSGPSTGGRFNIKWDATHVPSGVYFARLTGIGFAPVERKLVLLK